MFQAVETVNREGDKSISEEEQCANESAIEVKGTYQNLQPYQSSHH